MNFIEVANTIFENKHKYRNVTDKDKDDYFYIINKKLYLVKPEVAYFFNHKSIDKASALDLYYLMFKKYNKTPNNWWAKSKAKKDTIKKIPKSDKEMFMDYEQLNEKDFEFLYEHYKDDVDYKIKLLKRLDG